MENGSRVVTTVNIAHACNESIEEGSARWDAVGQKRPAISLDDIMGDDRIASIYMQLVVSDSDPHPAASKVNAYFSFPVSRICCSSCTTVLVYGVAES